MLFFFLLLSFQIIFSSKINKILPDYDIIISGSYQHQDKNNYFGENIKFVCYANDTNQKYSKSIKWNGPNIIPKLTINLNSIQSEFVINKVKKEDEKEYECIITDGTRNVFISQSLYLKDPPPVGLNILGKSSEKIILNKHQNITLQATAVGFPIPIRKKFVWQPFVIPNEIKPKFLSKDIKSSITEKLILNNVDLRDSGNYTFIAENNYSKKKKTFEVYVKGLEIMLNLTQKNDYIKFGETRQISCAATSYPKINKFDWHIVPCNWEKEPHYKCMDKFRQHIGSTILDSDEPSLSYSTILNFTNNEKLPTLYNITFGLITCTAYNNYKNKNSSAKLYFGKYDKPIVAFINDEKINYTINNEITEKSVKVDDKLNVTCEALKSKYIHKIEWCKALNMTSADCFLISAIDSNRVIVNSSTNLAYRSTLLFSKAQLDDNGLYKCKFWTRSDNTSETVPVINLIIISSNTSTSGWLYGIILVLIIIVLILAYFFVKYLKMRKNLKKLGLQNFLKGKPDLINPELILNKQAELLPYNENYEIPRKRIQLEKLLGQGSFGSVYMASVAADSSKTSLCFKSKKIECPEIVAVKMLRQDKDTDPRLLQALGSELKIMQHIGKCSYVINLLGAVTRTIHKCELMLIIEYCKYGSLEVVLIKNRHLFIDQLDSETNLIHLEHINRFDSVKGNIIIENESIGKGIESKRPENLYILPMEHIQRKGIEFNTTDLIIWSSQIACGMSHLASLKIVHGDLAARNILLSDDFGVKICDFGLAKQMYQDELYKQLPKKQILPVMWCSIEAIEDKKLTTESDVWSYGVLLWELFSLGKTPYSEIESFDLNFINQLKNGYRLEQPRYTNETIYNIMFRCWNRNPLERPTFYNISKILKQYLADGIIPNCNPFYFNVDNDPGEQQYNNSSDDEAPIYETTIYENPYENPIYENVNSVVPKFNKKQSENYPFSVLTPTLNNYENLQSTELNPNTDTNVNLPSYTNFNATRNANLVDELKKRFEKNNNLRK